MANGDHLFKKGMKKPPDSGRKPGVQNLDTARIKHMIVKALDNAGGEKYLTEQAHKNPRAFLMLVARVLPKDVTVTHDATEQLAERLARARELLG